MTGQEIKEIICKRFLGGDLDFPLERDTQLLDEGICDSLGLVQIAQDLEQRCPGLVIQDQDILRENLGSIAAIERFLETRGRG